MVSNQAILKFLHATLFVYQTVHLQIFYVFFSVDLIKTSRDETSKAS